MKKIYVASSWRNIHQPGVVNILRSSGHEVYDFRNPPDGSKGFAWSEIDPNWMQWTTDQYRAALTSKIAQQGFSTDYSGMKWADTCVLVLPAGRSANTEAGWMKGAGKRVYVYVPFKQEPELMYLLHDGIFSDMEELLNVLMTEQ